MLHEFKSLYVSEVKPFCDGPERIKLSNGDNLEHYRLGVKVRV